MESVYGFISDTTYTLPQDKMTYEAEWNFSSGQMNFSGNWCQNNTEVCRHLSDMLITTVVCCHWGGGWSSSVGSVLGALPCMMQHGLCKGFFPWTWS